MVWTVNAFDLGAVSASTVGGSQVTLRLEGGRYTGNTGCRAIASSHQVDAQGGIRFEAGTLDGPACPNDDLAQQERELTTILEVISAWEIEGDRLELSGGDMGLTLFVEP